MKRKHPFYLFSFGLLFMLFQGCSDAIHRPLAHDVPLHTERNQYDIGLNFSLKSASLQATASPINHFSVTANASSGAGESTRSGQDTLSSWNFKASRFGVEYYGEITDSVFFRLQAGTEFTSIDYLFPNFTGRIFDRDTNNYLLEGTAVSSQWYIQPMISRAVGEFTGAFGVKVAMFNKFDLDYTTIRNEMVHVDFKKHWLTSFICHAEAKVPVGRISVQGSILFADERFIKGHWRIPNVNVGIGWKYTFPNK